MHRLQLVSLPPIVIDPVLLTSLPACLTCLPCLPLREDCWGARTAPGLCEVKCSEKMQKRAHAWLEAFLLGLFAKRTTDALSQCRGSARARARCIHARTDTRLTAVVLKRSCTLPFDSDYVHSGACAKGCSRAVGDAASVNTTLAWSERDGRLASQMHRWHAHHRRALY